jgi:hypothetical protein
LDASFSCLGSSPQIGTLIELELQMQQKMEAL